MQSPISRSDSIVSNGAGYNGGYTAVSGDDVSKKSRGSYDTTRDASLAAGNISDDSAFKDLEDESLTGSRLRSTSTIETISKRRLPFPEYLSVVANSTNALLGVSIFATPWGFAKSGLLGGTIITIFVASLSFETARVLLEAQRILYLRTGEVKSYPEIVCHTLGPRSALLVHWATAVSCLGGCVGFLIFLAELSGQLFHVSHVTVTMAVTLPLVLLSWIRSFKDLTAFTAIGVLALISSIMIILIDGIKTTNEKIIEETPLLLPLESTLTFLGPATFCYTIHYCVLAIGAENLICVKNEKISYALVASADRPDRPESPENSVHGNEFHGNNNREYELEKINGNKNMVKKPCSKLEDADVLETETSAEKISKVSFKRGLQTLPDPSISPDPHVGRIGLLDVPNRDVLCVISDISSPLLSAYFLTSLLNIMLGAAGYAFYRESPTIRGPDGYPQTGCEDRVCQNIILNLPEGPIKKIVGLVLCVSITFGFVLILAPVRENIETELIRILQWKAEKSIRKAMLKNSLRTFLVVSSAAIAILAPYFGEVLGAVGGLTDALQSFVFPPLICLCMRYKGSLKLSIYRKCFYFFVLIWGLGIIIYTIVKLIKKL